MSFCQWSQEALSDVLFLKSGLGTVSLPAAISPWTYSYSTFNGAILSIPNDLAVSKYHFILYYSPLEFLFLLIIVGWEEICQPKIIQPLSAQNSFLYENILSVQSSNSISGLCLPSQKEGSSWTCSSPRWHTKGEAHYIHSVRAELLSTCCPLGLHWPERSLSSTSTYWCPLKCG